MVDQSFYKARERILSFFPERQFFHRTGGEVNFFVLSTKAQLALASVAGLLLLWCIVTFGNLLWGRNPFRSDAKELRVQKEHYERYMVDLQAQETSARDLLAEQQKQFQLAAHSFEDKHNTLVAMLTHGGIAEQSNQEKRSTYTDSTVMMSPALMDFLRREARSELATATKMHTGTILDPAMLNLDIDQNMRLLDGEGKMLATIDSNRAILKSTGIDVLSAMKNGQHGMGGPFIALEHKSSSADKGEMPPRLQTIQARASEVAILKGAVASAPLGYPIDAESYQTSGFGIRKDPFTKRPTKHNGLDIASYRLAPIVATADGKITFSGIRAGYGRVVEIDHGYGFKTRYAHLAKTHVKRGAKVKQGDKIAGMGSSGRSTSTHLHYEVLFDNRPYDPTKFLKAGKYVQ